MAKEKVAEIKLYFPAGQANPAPPVEISTLPRLNSEPMLLACTLDVLVGVHVYGFVPEKDPFVEALVVMVTAKGSSNHSPASPDAEWVLTVLPLMSKYSPEVSTLPPLPEVPFACAEILP